MSTLYSFLAACMRTKYTVDIPNRPSLVLSIGIPNLDLDHLLHRFQASTYAYLTAYNPNSTSLSRADNQRRHEQLCRELELRGFHYVTGKAIPDSDAWEPEVCMLVFNISHTLVQEVCLLYAQDAALVGNRGAGPKLFVTNPQLRADFLMLLHSEPKSEGWTILTSTFAIRSTMLELGTDSSLGTLTP